MNWIGKKIKQTLTMLMVFSILVGSVPVNAHEPIGAMAEMEYDTSSENLDEITEAEWKSDNIIEEDVLNNTAAVEQEAEDGLLSVSLNDSDKLQEEVEIQEVAEEVVDMTFTVSENSFSSYVKVFQIHKDKPETEVKENKVSVAAREPLKFRVEVAEGYKIAMVKFGSGMLVATEGVYTVIPTQSGVIEIQVAELKKYDVTFSYKEEFIKELAVKMGTKDVMLQENIAIGMWEDSIVSFIPELDEMAKVVKVTANEKEILSLDGVTFSLPPLDGDVYVEIEASLDDKKCNTLDIGVVGHHNSVSLKNNGVLYENGKRLLSKNSSEEIVIVPNGNYEIDKIILNSTMTLYDKNTDNEDKFSAGMAAFNIDFSNKKNQAIFIYTTPKKSNEKKKIVFANRAEHITYEVVTHAVDDPDRIIVKKDSGKKDTFTVNSGETLVEFKLTAMEGYEPHVVIEGVEYDVTVTNNVYTYSLAVATLGNGQAPTEITIDEVVQYRTVSVVYDAEKLEKISAISNGKYIRGKESYDGENKLTTQKFVLSHGTEIVLRLETKKGFLLEKIKETKAEELLSEIKPQETEYSYTVKADKDKNVELQLGDTYIAKVYEVQEEEFQAIENENGIYPVEEKRNYKTHLYHGSQIQTVSKAVLKGSKKTYQNNVKIIDSENVFVEIPEREVGKKLILELTYKEGSKEQIFVIEMQVLANTKITKIAGITKGKVSQTTDTIKSYKYSINMPDAHEKIGVEIVTAKAEEDIISENHRKELNEKANTDFAAKIVENELVIFVKTTKENEQAYIKLYDLTRSTKNKKHYIENGVILITSKAPAFIKTKPTVSQKSSTNLKLILNLGTKNFEKFENGELWYKIEGIPKISHMTDDSVKNNVSEFIRYVRCTGKSQTDSIRVAGVSENSLKEGDLKQKADFEIKVSLVQTTDKNEPQSDNETKFVSKTSATKKMSTKVPAYETKLGVKVVKSAVYSGQKDVVVATPVFSKKTTYQKIDCVSRKEGITVTVDEKNNILASVEQTVKPGKYDIELIAEAAENTVPATKIFKLQVVQGIYEISLNAPKRIYKDYQKKATFKLGITYNENNEIQPKTKKVEWSLQDSEGKDIDKKHPYYNIFTIKNGVVTIHKDFIVSDFLEENKFRVKAVAKDYVRGENEVVGYSDWILITNEKLTLGELVLVKESETQKGVYEVTARSGNKAFIDKVHNSQIVILKKGTPERDKYTENDFVKGIEELLVYSSNHKVATIDKKTISGNDIFKGGYDISGNGLERAIYTVSVNDIVEGLTITAKTEDGSKVKTELSNVNVCYSEAGDLGVVIKKSENHMSVLESYAGGSIEFYGTKDEAFTIKIQEKVNGVSRDIFGADHQLKVEGAKVVSSRKLTGEYQIVATGDIIKIQLINSLAGYTKTFTLKNASFNHKNVKESKALKLSVKGNLKTGYFTDKQIITYTLPKESIGKYTHVWITADKLDYYNKKKTAIYEQLIKASGKTIGEIQRIGRDGKIVISFEPEKGKENYYIPEENITYKLNISLGTLTEDYEFKAEVKSSEVSLKTKVEQLPSAPINTSYSISAKENGMAELSLKNKKLVFSDVGNLMNKNINGVQNKFTDYFEVSKKEENSNYVIKLKANVDVSKITKNDLSGYVSYYTFTDGQKDKTLYHASIKVNLKEQVHKHSLSKAVVLTKDKIDTNVKLLCGTQKVNVKYAYVPREQNFNVFVNEDGTLKIQSKSGVQIKSGNNCIIYVIPEYSYYLPIINGLLEKEDISTEEITEAFEKYSMKLKATISVKDKEKATGKIKFNSNNLKPQLTSENFELKEQSGESLDGVYTVKVPYTQVVDWEVKEITNLPETSLVKVEKTEGEDSVTLTLEKERLRNTKIGGKAIYGKTVTIKAIAKFGEGTKDENITFKVKLPKQPLQLKNVVDELDKTDWSEIKVQYEGLTKEQLESVNKEAVENKVKEVLGKDSDLMFTVSGNEFTTVPSRETDGEVGYNIIISDTTTEPLQQKKFVLRIPLSRIFTQPIELKESLQEAIQYWKSKKISNNTTMASILTSVKGKVKINEYRYLRLYAKEVQITLSTYENVGKMKGIFCIYNIADRQAENLELPFEFEIPKLMKLDDAVNAVKAALEQIVIYNIDLNDNKEQKTREILEAAKKVLEQQEYLSVQIKPGSSLLGTLAGGGIAGTASLKLEIISVTTQRESQDVTCEFKVLEAEK